MTDTIKQIDEARRSRKHPSALKKYREKYGESPLIIQDKALSVLQKMASGGDWLEIEYAPLDEEIIGKYDDGEATIIWSENPVCILGARNGSFPAGWATAGGETDDNLPMDEPEFFKFKDPAKHIAMMMEKEMRD